MRLHIRLDGYAARLLVDVCSLETTKLVAYVPRAYSAPSLLMPGLLLLQVLHLHSDGLSSRSV